MNRRRIAKIGAGIVLAYVALVAVLELSFGYLQPDMEGAVIIITRDAEGNERERTLAGFRFNGQLYVASNHWLRGWYHQALANPRVEVIVDGQRGAYQAVPLAGEELDQLENAYRMGFVLRAICGFAPSRFLRLDRREAIALDEARPGLSVQQAGLL